MNKKFLIISSIYLYLNFFCTVLLASSDTVIKIDPNKIKEGVNKIFSGEVPKLEIALRGKKLSDFFKDNNLSLNFNEKNKEYKFKDGTYEVFNEKKLVESGRWKIHGLTKGQIKLNPENGSQSYYFKKIANKNIIYFFDKVPGNQDLKKTLIKIESIDNNEGLGKVASNKEPKKEKPKEVVENKETKKKEPKKIVKKKEPKKEDPKKIVKKKKPKKEEFKFSKLTEKQKKEFEKLEKEAQQLRIIDSDDSYIEITKGKIKGAQFIASNHCAKYKKFAYKFEDSSYGKWYESFKRSTYFYCSDLLLFTNPFTNKEVTWTNYDDKNFYEFPNEHLFVYRKISNSYKKIINKEKKENPKRFVSSNFRIIHKDKDSIHIWGNALGDLLRERYVANEHCSQQNKKYYYFEDSIQRGQFGSIYFFCSSNHLSMSPYGTSSPLMYASGSENYSVDGDNFNASQMLKYNVTSNTTYFYFESTDNLMGSLQLLYLAYGENVKAEQLRAQMAYNKESKYSEADKLETTRTIVDSYSSEILSKINNESLTLDSKGKDYYYQALPYALEAAKNVTSLILVINETFQKGTKDADSLLAYSGEFIGLLSISKDLPKLAKDVFKTSQLVFSGAKSKKIKDNEKYDKALSELNFEI